MLTRFFLETKWQASSKAICCWQVVWIGLDAVVFDFKFAGHDEEILEARILVGSFAA